MGLNGRGGGGAPGGFSPEGTLDKEETLSFPAPEGETGSPPGLGPPGLGPPGLGPEGGVEEVPDTFVNAKLPCMAAPTGRGLGPGGGLDPEGGLEPPGGLLPKPGGGTPCGWEEEKLEGGGCGPKSLGVPKDCTLSWGTGTVVGGGPGGALDAPTINGD